METEILYFNDSVIVPQSIKILVKVSSGESVESKVKEIRGMLKEYKSEYSSVELQRKSGEWWKNVSD
ncbi:MAG: hypothetical protein CVT89_01760 [Candidatus Altiarchaeales archaeon HGW-Altiarchaeales-2]|nr:MAG: hypothetical protein CVT89_01760 [Candidatus Altiarchaeales archaeon HGW-Altiarchaeales-2]